MAKKIDKKLILLAYLVPPVLALVGYSSGYLHRMVFAVLMSLLLAIELALFFSRAFKGVDRMKGITIVTLAVTSLLVAAGTYQGVIRGRLVFEDVFSDKDTKPVVFKARGPLEIDIEGAFKNAGRDEENGSYHLNITDGKDKQDLKGKFSREWYKVSRGRKRSSKFTENVAGMFSVGNGGKERDWQLTIVKLDENIDGKFHVSIFEPILPALFGVIAGILMALAIILLEYFNTRKLAAKSRFTQKLMQDMPPATWLAVSALFYMIIYPIASSGIFIERGFIVAIPGAFVGGIIVAWLMQMLLYKNMKTNA